MKNVTRTKRIYNSYDRWGRWMPKWDYEYGTVYFPDGTTKWMKILQEPYPAGIPLKDRRWHPYAVWCMGRCCGCRNHKKDQNHAKHRRKDEEMKFVYDLF